MKSKTLLIFVSSLLIFSLVLGGCSTTNNNAVEESAVEEEVVEESVEETAEEVEEEAVAAESEEEVVEEVAEPSTIIVGIATDPDTLDPHMTALAASNIVMTYLGSSLIALDEDGNFQPYLAESWEVSEDGLTYIFKLREDVLFHDGTAMTAEDVAFTYNRALDPDIASPSAGPSLGPMESITALDDYTVEFKLSSAYYPFLYGLADSSYMMILSQDYVETNGADYLARNPMSVGPYKFVEWVTADYVLLEKNPDFNWGPEFWGNTGPWNIDYMKFLIVPEQATMLAGMEAGEIDFAQIETKDLELFETDEYEIIELPQQGLSPYITFQTTAAPLDDINVRKALNMAIDRDTALLILEQGNGVVQYGPLSPSQIGYWEEVEEYGYAYNPEEAKALLEESGYTLNADGIYEKDGEALSFTLYTIPLESWVKAAELSQSMFADIGVEVTIEQDEQGVLVPVILGGEYRLSMFGMTSNDPNILYQMFHSSQIGGFNYAFVDDPILDEILERSRTETDADAHQQAINEAQQYITEQAYLLPIYAPINYYVLNGRVKDCTFSSFTYLLLSNAYIE